ncbi:MULTISPECIES: NAD(P)H-binding protein [Kitasatospora]|uniref:NAD(P)H-binding protein n=1 Tax=Kitasatospora cathayae TaxID=3004092 RepID=A0ABY7Q6I3_9ACTN|nr:NAD(P)H-binding protein [Kitasatospora sp. HUAS 3-15]WBP88279.1 NAD(P)H-binding protein [Kitasatospora sp. HUAS 3-15]
MFLITGATGNVGRALVEHLVEEGVPVRAVTRNPESAEFPEGVEVVSGDPSSPESLAEALSGVSGLFLNPAAVGGSTAGLLELARERGVKRVVMLSSDVVVDGVAEQTDSIAAWHKQIEETVVASGLEWTILRAGEFATNLIGLWGPQIRATGVVRAPYGHGTTAPIHERDIAATAVRALLTDEHLSATYSLTGPKSLTRVEMVEIIAQVLDRPVRFEELSPEQALQAILAQGTPKPIADSILALQAESVGREAHVGTGVEAVTGKPARPFAEWVADHSGVFA